MLIAGVVKPGESPGKAGGLPISVTTVQQRQEIAHRVAQGTPYQTVAYQNQVSYWTVRKWARRARQGGLEALVTQGGRPGTGLLADGAFLVRYVALRLKRQHPTWGAAYVLKQMRQHPALQGKKLPSTTTLWRYWRRFGDRLRPPRLPASPPTPLAGVAHGVWQMDAKESVLVPGVGTTTFNQARDEFGRATVLHRAHPAQDEDQRIVKLTGDQVQQDGRLAFTQWGLPDAMQTDRAPIFVDADPTPFPTRLTLWWVGLGIEHRLIPRHTPQRNGSVERSHRTLTERTLTGQHFQGAHDLQQRVDADWAELNTECPSRARGGQGQPPLVAHPELLVPRRPYQPEQEEDLFDWARVETYLATQTWLRTVSQVGQVTLGNKRYGLGVAWAGQTVSIHFEPQQRHCVFTQVKPATKRGRAQPELAPIRLDVQGLTLELLIGQPTPINEEPTPQTRIHVKNDLLASQQGA